MIPKPGDKYDKDTQTISNGIKNLFGNFNSLNDSEFSSNIVSSFDWRYYPYDPGEGRNNRISYKKHLLTINKVDQTVSLTENI
jgi:hypothetical protein